MIGVKEYFPVLHKGLEDLWLLFFYIKIHEVKEKSLDRDQEIWVLRGPFTLMYCRTLGTHLTFPSCDLLCCKMKYSWEEVISV